MTNQIKTPQKDLNIKNEPTKTGKRIDVGVGHKNPQTTKSADIEKTGSKNLHDKRF